MSKSRARFLAEILNTNGLVIETKSALAGADGIVDLDNLPTITNAKLENSSISIAGHSTALGGSVSLDTEDISEHTSYLYFTNARADARIVAAGSANWNTAYGWGDHSTEGYLTSHQSLAAYAPLASPTFTGTPAAPTASAGTNTTQLATTAFVGTAVSGLVDSAPGTLDTLNELAAALGDDANFSTTVTNSIATKLPLAGGTLTGNVTFGDNNKAIFGAGSDLQIYHDGSDSWLVDNGTGGLKFGVAGTGTSGFYKNTGSEAIATFEPDGPVTLYNNNSAKLATSSTGIDVTGTATMDGLTVDGLSQLGTVDIYDNGTISVIAADSGHDLELRGRSGQDVNIVSNGTQTASFTSTGVDVTGNLTVDAGSNGKIDFGNITTNYGRLYADSTGTFVGSVTADPLILRTTNTERMRIDSGGNAIFTKANGAYLQLKDASAVRGAINVETSDGLVFTTGASFTERMRIQSNGAIQFNQAYTFPTSDGTSGQVLSTDGSGNLTFSSAAGGSGDITAVVAGTNLTGGATSGSATINLATNLSGLGTISSGAITSTSSILAMSGSNEILLGTDGAIEITRTAGGAYIDFKNSASEDFDQRIQATTTGHSLSGTISSGAITSSGALSVNSGSANIAATFQSTDSTAGIKLQDSAGNVELSASGSTFRVQPSGGSPVFTVNSSGNATFAGTISSGAITATDTSNITALHINNQITTSSAKLQVNGFMRTGTIYLHQGTTPSSSNYSLSTDSNGVLAWDTNTVWHAGNDGAGSGLDADTLDGIQGADYLRSHTSDTINGVLTVGGTSVGSAEGGEIRFTQSTSNNLSGTEVVFDSLGNGLRFFENGGNSRGAYIDLNTCENGATSKIYHSGNDGAGSGLDADTLDGIQGSSYLRSDAADTMTGALTIDVDNQANGALRIVNQVTDTNNDFYFAQEISQTLSGSQAATSDREQGGIYLDINSTNTGGDTDNEHRAYGIFIDLDATGDADAVYGIYSNATVTPTTGTVSAVYGGYFWAEDNGGAGATTNIHGITGFAYSDNSTSDINNMYGGYFKSYNAADSGAIAKAHGVYSEVEITASSGDIYGNTYVYRAELDNNAGAQSNTTYLYYGNYAGTLPTNPYGVYIANNVPNYFAGRVEAPEFRITDANTKLIEGSGNAVRVQTNSGYVDIGAQNSTYAHIYTDRGSFYFNKTTLYASGNTMWHAGNDGSGSGLDADTLDGIDSARIVFGSGSRRTVNSDPNNNASLNSGFYDVYQTNAPTATWYSYITMAHNNTANYHGHQIAGSFFNDGQLFNRHYDGNTASFGNWTQIWNAANDGSGSGLDADTVDSLHATSFIRSDTNDNVTGSTEWQDNNEVRFGNSADTRIWHDGSHTNIRSYKHGQNIYIQGENSSGTNQAIAYFRGDSVNGAELYSQGSLKFYTHSSGAICTGTLSATVNNIATLIRVSGTNANAARPIVCTDTGNSTNNNSNLYKDEFGGFTYNPNLNEIIVNGGSFADNEFQGNTLIGDSLDIRINSSTSTAIIEGNSTYMVFRHLGTGVMAWKSGSADTDMELTTAGALRIRSTLTQNFSFSDKRLKKNIEVIPNALEKVQKLDGITFNYKKDNLRGTGLIAQQLEEVLPEAVYTTTKFADEEDQTEYLAVKYETTVGLLVEAIKELKAEVDELKTKLGEK